MGLRSFVRAVVGSAVGLVFGTRGTVDKTEDTGSSLLGWIGDLIFGHSAESVTKRTAAIAPAASTTPLTQGRLSQGPGGNDVLRDSGTN